MNNSIWALWLTLSYEVANMYFSVGIVTALTFGVIILLHLRLHDPIQSPTILPDPWAEGAQDTLALPGGLRISCPLSREQMMLIGLVWLAAMIGMWIWSTREEGRLKRLGQQGERLPP